MSFFSVQSVLDRARVKLADPRKARWPDEELLQYFNEGYIEYTTTAELLRSSEDLTVVPAQAVYTLAEDAAFKLTGFASQFGALTLKSTVQLYAENPTWRTDEGSKVLNIIYDKQNIRTFTVYPIPTADSVDVLTINFVHEPLELTEVDTTAIDLVHRKYLVDYVIAESYDKNIGAKSKTSSDRSKREYLVGLQEAEAEAAKDHVRANQYAFKYNPMG